MSAKDIVLKQIDSRTARAFVKKHHYSGKVASNSQIHLGVFWDGKLEGVLQYGPSLDKRKIQGLVKDTGWHEFLELNRMVFTDALPRNSESRAIAISFRLLRKYAPQIKWIISFADGTQCGDGTIYRASGFVLTSVKKNDQIWEAPSVPGEDKELITRFTNPKGKAIIHSAAARTGGNKDAVLPNGGSSMKRFVDAGWKPIKGHQLRYIYFIDKSYRERLTVPELPFSEIEKRGAKMYKGQAAG